MFCPKCGKENSTEQKFCRACGLNLEKTAENLQEQLAISDVISPSKISKFFEKLGKIGFGGLIGAGLVGIFLIIISLFNKFIFSGQTDKIFLGVFLIIFFVCGILGLAYVIFQEYLKEKQRNSNLIMQKEFESKITAKLLEEKDFEPIPSITENSTELFLVENKTNKFQ